MVRFILSFMSALVFCGCRNNLPQSWWQLNLPIKVQIYYLEVLEEVRSQKWASPG